MEIRYAQPDDIPGMALVYVKTWQAAYQGMIAQNFLDQLSPSRWEESYQKSLGKEGRPKAAVLLEGGQVIGVSSFNKTRDEDLGERYGEIISLYVLPEYWRMGLGSQMLCWVTRELKNMGFSHCMLWTLEDNVRAQRAYERFGFQKDGQAKGFEIGGGEVTEIRYQMKLQ